MTREIGFRLVDVFAPRPLEGNQLCVVSEPGDLEHDRMLDVAREIAFSETTFVTATRPDGYDVRIFTPDEEIPFAGHPTLGTAYVLASDRRIGPTATQVSAAGGVPVEVDVASSFAWMTQMPPLFADPFDDRELLARASGLRAPDLHPDLPAQVVTTGLPPLIVPIRDVETLRRARIDRTAVAEACDASAAEELYLFAVGRDTVTARFFGPTPAIVEDPGPGPRRGRWVRTWPSTVSPGCPAASSSSKASRSGGRASCTSRWSPATPRGGSASAAASTSSAAASSRSDRSRPPFRSLTCVFLDVREARR